MRVAPDTGPPYHPLNHTMRTIPCKTPYQSQSYDISIALSQRVGHIRARDVRSFQTHMYPYVLCITGYSKLWNLPCTLHTCWWSRVAIYVVYNIPSNLLSDGNIKFDRCVSSAIGLQPPTHRYSAKKNNF